MGKCLNIYTHMFESQKSFCGSDCSRVCEERVLLMWKTLLLLLLFFFKGQNGFVEWKDLFFRSTPFWTSLF